MADDKVVEVEEKLKWFVDARYGLMVHYGLYSILGRGEWAMNREEWDRVEYRALAKQFNPSAFDAEAICEMALQAGMKYIVMGTMHHDGFRLYKTKLSDFNSWTVCGRDLVAEIVAAAKKRGLRIALYHSLNCWMELPDSVDALENPADYEKFIVSVHARCIELVELFQMDVFWYDGWWPFDPQGWRAAELKKALLARQPHLLFNPRDGQSGDFATPENHMGAPYPWRPWEGCITINDSWCHHQGDHEWKSPSVLISLLAAAAAGRGNLLLNVGPMANGAVQPEAIERINAVGAWLRRGNAEAVFGTTHVWSFDLQQRGHHRGDWNHHGPCSVKGDCLYIYLRRYPSRDCIIGGLSPRLLEAAILSGGHDSNHNALKPLAVSFTQTGTKVSLQLPETSPDPICSVLRLRFDGVPSAYQTGGLRVPKVPHPHYDPVPSELLASPSH